MKAQIIALLLVFSIAQNGSSQILGNIFDKATDRIADKISDKISEAIYDEIEKRTVKAVDEAMDDMLKERYEQDSISGKTSSGSYSDFLSKFMTPVDLPASYTFDMVLLADTRDYDGEKNTIEFMVTKDGSLIGINQIEEGNNTKIIFDMKNNIMATYTIEDGEKKVVAMPNMLNLGGAFIKANVDEEDMKTTMKKTGKTKKIEGYKCNEWLIEDEKTKTKAYIAEEFPISWKESHGQFLKHILPTTNKDEMPEGMALKSESKTKKKNKKSSFVVTKIIDEPTIINNSEYEKVDYTAEN